MSQIYVLELKNKKYYIGITDDLENRINQHFNGIGSEWTRMYHPVKVVKTIKANSKFDEDNITKEYMSKYGIDNVRGGSYVKINLDPIQKYNLQKEIWNSTGLCLRCGRDNHKVKNCYAKTNIEGEEIIEFDSDLESDSDSDSDCCYRCGRIGHYASECYAKTDINGKRIW